MLIIGCDYHPGFQQIAFVDSETGGRRTSSQPPRRSGAVLPGAEASEISGASGDGSSGHSAGSSACWTSWRLSCGSEMLPRFAPSECGSRRRIARMRSYSCGYAGRPLSADLGTRRGQSGHAAAAVASTPLGADAHAGDESVACGGTERRVATQEGAVAASRPSGLESIVLAPWASRRRQDLLNLLDQLTPKIQELTRALEQEVEKRPVTRRLMTHPGVGPLTALAYELVIGTPERFHCGKQIASYLGLVPEEKSSGDRRDWDTSASKATCYSGFCWWKRRRSRCEVTRSGAISSFTSPSGGDGRLPR